MWVNHIAFRVNTVQELEDTKARLQAHGVEVLGVTDHHIFKSIYFFDPNGIRLELAAQLANDRSDGKRQHRGSCPTAKSGRHARSNGARNVPKARPDAPLKPQSNDRPEFCASKPT